MIALGKIAAMDSEQMGLYLKINGAMAQSDDGNVAAASAQAALTIGALIMLSLTDPATLNEAALEALNDGD